MRNRNINVCDNEVREKNIVSANGTEKGCRKICHAGGDCVLILHICKCSTRALNRHIMATH